MAKKKTLQQKVAEEIIKEKFNISLTSVVRDFDSAILDYNNGTIGKEEAKVKLRYEISKTKLRVRDVVDSIGDRSEWNLVSCSGLGDTVYIEVSMTAGQWRSVDDEINKIILSAEAVKRYEMFGNKRKNSRM